MQENVALIKEINDLRKELKAARGESKQLQGTLKTTRTLAQMRGRELPTTEETKRLAGALRCSMWRVELRKGKKPRRDKKHRQRD